MCLLIAPLSPWLSGLWTDRPGGLSKYLDSSEPDQRKLAGQFLPGGWGVNDGQSRTRRRTPESLVHRDLGSWSPGRIHPQKGDIQQEANAMVG